MFKKRKKKTAATGILRQSGVAEADLMDASNPSDASAAASLKRKLKSAQRESSNKNDFQSSTNLQSALHKDVDTLHAYGSSNTGQRAEYSGGATATLEVDTAFDRDARAIAEKKIKIAGSLNTSTSSGSGKEVGLGLGLGGEEKVYRGQAGYSSFVRRTNDDISKNKVTGTLGPLRAPTNVRSTSRFDYQPDICKDYKDTGYCGYGDNCKFLHDRSNYKAGWEIEKEWEQDQQKKKQRLARGEPVDERQKPTAEREEEDKPFACHICRQKFTKPVKTQCNHYFCQKCALGHYAKSPKCAVCGKPTKGIFNTADI